MKRKKWNRKQILVLAAAVILLAAGLTGCSSVGAEETGTPLATLGEETIFLEEAVFYTRMLQESWEYQYYEYYGEDLWQEEVSSEIGTLGDALKSDVMAALTEIHLLCAHAADYQVELTKEEEREIARRAEKFLAGNTPEVLEAAGATLETVEQFLLRNELAAKVSAAAQEQFEPEIDEEAARVGKLTYALFATTGTSDAEGNRTPYTEEELKERRRLAEEFAVLALEVESVSEAGEKFPHTVIDVYYNEESDGGAHELVAAAARALEVGGISDLIETAEGYYLVQRVSEYDAEATQENIEYQKEQERFHHTEDLITGWLLETPLHVDEALWGTVEVKELLSNPAALD